MDECPSLGPDGFCFLLFLIPIIIGWIIFLLVLIAHDKPQDDEWY